MTIIELLKKETLGIEYAYKWLYWNTSEEKWTVRERKPYERNSRLICETDDEQAAVEALME